MILGFDIGGTKCAVITADWDGENITLLKKEKCPTDRNLTPTQMIDKLIGMADAILDGKIEGSFEAADVFLREYAATLGLTPVK